MIKYFFCALMIFSNVASAEVLEYQLFIPKHLLSLSEGIIQAGLRTVESVRIEDFRIQPGEKGGRMDFAIEITDQPVRFGLNQTMSDQSAYRADAYSMIVDFEGKSLMVIRLVWPELFYEKINGQLKPRTDGFARLVAALGHEVFGNIRNFHNRLDYYTSSSYQDQTRDFQKEWRVSEIKAFAGGVKFLETLLRERGEVVQPKFKMDLLDALEREKEALDRYLKLDREKSGLKYLDQVLNNKMSQLIIRCESVFNNN